MATVFQFGELSTLQARKQQLLQAFLNSQIEAFFELHLQMEALLEREPSKGIFTKVNYLIDQADESFRIIDLPNTDERKQMAKKIIHLNREIKMLQLEKDRVSASP